MIDTRSPTWQHVEKWAEQKIEEMRTRLEGPLDADQTARARGAIGTLRKLLAQSNPTPPAENANEV